MSQNEIVTSSPLGLHNSIEEPIRTCGSIQPHGLLFVLKEPHLEILQVSSNTFDFIGLPPEDLLNKPLDGWLDSSHLHYITECISQNIDFINPINISLKVENQLLAFDGFIHRSNEFLILEIERTPPITNKSYFGHYLVKSCLAKIQNASTLVELCQVMAREIRKITGFDRVMIYQFNPEGSGAAIAEDKLEGLISYLDLHFPASDIPEQVKQDYALSSIRFIPDVNYQAVELLPKHNSVTNQPIDLTLAVLRGVSPCHLEYLRNMGVSASMSIPLIKNKSLWGLIACHHQAAKYIHPEVRTACELLGQVMSLELSAKEDNADLDYKINLKLIQAKFVEAVSQGNNLVEGLIKDKINLLNLVGAQGAAVCSQGDFTLIGKTPENADMQGLIAWLETQLDNDILYTDSLPKIYPAAERFKDTGSGLLALSIAKTQKLYVLWFRPEVIQIVKWGGNPNIPFEAISPEESQGANHNNLRLSPRKSFDLWQETVRLKSLPWKSCEIEAAVELKSAIVGIVLRKADELAKINIELERSNSELDAFAYIASHDLKEPLRGIHNYSSFLLEDYADVLCEEGIAKLQTLVRLTQRMEDLIDSLLHFSRVGRIEFSMQQINLNELVNEVIDVLRISLKVNDIEIRIPQPLPAIQGDPVQISEVFSNLLSNAIKYNDKLHKWVEIGFLNSPHPHTQKRMTAEEREHNELSTLIVFYVRDNGIGIKEKHQETIFRIFKRLHGSNKYGGGTGAGLTIAKKIVERHNGKIWVESTYGAGSTFYFTLPS